MSIWHLADPDDWAAARACGSYRCSTRGRSLEDEGFIHASTEEQWPRVRRMFYSDLRGPLLLLEIDPERLGAEVRFEVGDPASPERFPHIYGPLDVDAVTSVRRLDPPH